jgi:hypothetical protein
VQALVDEGLASGVAEAFEIGQFLAEMRARAEVSAEWTRPS